MKEIQLTQGKVALVDDGDFEHVNAHKWYAACSRGLWYARRKVNNRIVRMHAFIFGEDWEVDHINGNTLDNRRDNLRFATRGQNTCNRRVWTHSTPYKGVSFRKGKGAKPFHAYVCLNKKQIHLGFFATAEEAAMAYNEAATRLHGEFARLNEVA